MSTLFEVLPRASRTMQRRFRVRAAMRRFRMRRQARAIRRAFRPNQRFARLAALSLGATIIATAAAFMISRRFATRGEELEGQKPEAVKPEQPAETLAEAPIAAGGSRVY